MKRTPSAMRGPHHEPELSRCVAYFTALARAKPSAQESEVAHVFAPRIAKKLVRRSDDGHACPSW
ncbi:hypothetical protein WMF27_41120 [Sorangium sp. So ce281]|uniref:hypothetical protein n=1 Tax=unclassified Sorangium TaxID=2621164 RepID=UPI003F5FE3F6